MTLLDMAWRIIPPRGGDELMTQYSGRTFENADSSSKVVDSPGGLEGSGDDGGRRDEIVGEGVVEVALEKWVSFS